MTSNEQNQDEGIGFALGDDKKISIDNFSIDSIEVNNDAENSRWLFNGDPSAEFSIGFETEVQVEEQIEMRVDDPRELAKRTGKAVITDADGKLVGLYEITVGRKE